MMWLATLKGVDKQSSAIEVHRPCLRNDRTIDGAPWPEDMHHGSPRMVLMFTEVARTVLTGLETRRGLLEGQIYDCLLRR